MPEIVNKVVEKKKEAVVTGCATFDGNGKLKVPVKESMQVPNEIKDLLNKKESQKAKQIKEKSAKVRQVKPFEPQFRKEFAERMSKKHGLEIVERDDRMMLKLGKRQIVRLMLRKSSRYCAYKNLKIGRENIKIVTDADESKLDAWIGSRVAKLKVDTKSKKVPK